MTLQEKINKLDEIYEKVEGGDESVAFLHDYLFDDDYLVRCRSFAITERLGNPALNQSLLAIVFSDEAREWQLRALSALSKVGGESDITQLKPLLFQREKPLVMRGALLVIATAHVFNEDITMPMLIEFAGSVYPDYLKPALVGDAFSLCLNRCLDPEKWLVFAKADSRLFSFYLGFATENPLLQVYPYPDYLTKMAAKKDITAQALKKAQYFKGKKVRTYLKEGS